MSSIKGKAESWMFDEEGKLFVGTDEEWHQRINEHFRQKYAGLSKPIVGREIFEMRDPNWALENLIQEEGITMIHGSPGAGKSLLAMDWAYSLASPQVKKWLGLEKLRDYKPLYVFTEGLNGLKTRSIAWAEERQAAIPTDEHGVVWVRDAVRLNRQDNTEEPWSEQVAALVQMYNDYERDILFVDTLANTFGGNENSQQDANNYLAAIRMFQEGGPVVIVHHNTKEGDDYRGSTVFEGAVDTKVAVKESDGLVHLYITKQKDGDPGFNMNLQITLHSWLSESQERELSSVALKVATDKGTITAKQQAFLDVIPRLAEEATAANIARELNTNASAATNFLNRLQEKGLVYKKPLDKTWHVWEPQMEVNEADEVEEL